MLELRLPPPPSQNDYWRTRRGQRGVYLTGEARAYKHAVEMLSMKALGRAQRFPIWVSDPITVVVHWFRNEKRGDLDNRLKVLLDALQGIVYRKDSQVDQIHAFRHELDREQEPFVRVTAYVSSAVMRDIWLHDSEDPEAERKATNAG